MKIVHFVLLIILFANQLIFAQKSIDKKTFQDSIAVDSYGGVLSIKGTPNEYFTIQQINGRYCFVTPEGHGMLALGVTHLGAGQEVAPNNIFQTKYIVTGIAIAMKLKKISEAGDLTLCRITPTEICTKRCLVC